MLAVLLLGAPAAAAAPAHRTENVILVMVDGLRWQEVFGGAVEPLLNKEQGVTDVEAAKARFWRPTAAERRQTLMPFLWSTVAVQGQLFGNRARGSDASVTNGLKFSYPGYSETLCGFVDPRVDSNKKVPNPSVSVLEWLNGKPAYRGKVAAFGMWSALPFILNRDRSGLVIAAGVEPLRSGPVTPRIALLNELKRDTSTPWPDDTQDALVFHTALEYLRENRPRVLLVLLGETDEWAHDRSYGRYLDAAARADEFIGRLWGAAQSLPQYRGKTTLIVLPDHGRGDGVRWTDHGREVADAEFVWLGVLGPDTPALGERADVQPVYSKQVASTLAAFLGETYRPEAAGAGTPILDVLPRR
jgi:hypothetical protein